MDGWKYYEGRKVYIVTKNNRNYSGKVIGVDLSSPPLVFIIIIDKYDKRITLSSGEIKLIQEEK